MDVEWIKSDGLVGYEDALSQMEAHVDAMIAGDAGERIWLLEHPPMYTAGTSARSEDLLTPERFDVFATKRGGQYTYHGPGQRIVYVMLDLNRRGRDVRGFVTQLETWVIAALARFNVRGEVHPDRVGVWVDRPEKARLASGELTQDKIAAIGVRLRKWVSFHGLAINVEPDLTHYDGIIPCGISGHGVTSLVDLGRPVALEDLDDALRASFKDVFTHAP
jgi:lipoyl(octanoyl) transferase